MKKIINNIILIIAILLNCTGCANVVYNASTGKEHISFISTSKEVKIGKSLSEKVEEQFGLLDDIEKQSRIEKIGKKLARFSYREDIIYHFDIIKEEEPNALALPGGYIYITNTLFDKLDNDNQLASVLAHEMGHIEARHSIYRLQKALGYGMLNVIINKNASRETSYKTSRAIGELFLSYSRQDEFEADKLSIDFSKKAGYNPYAIIEVLNKLKQINKEKEIERLKIRTHPYLNDRIREAKIRLEGKINYVDHINKTYEEKK